ncbi:carboxypeptidase-like regulatory domain-containing protein [Cohnella candidum]|uniref:Carboxypeptidase regulatory-like domain-containing protein n=1 Tax=Cohnella candidum TaxID=2674991 RepID=A0A3G3JTD4_9BACL|nr:carboxypeptidase-like regulatory domain-containing protein [Cohnella candidum]AYQ71490.1 carboxypeptidase regulatory-like domain-containing protein [Cohnella candidum]
MKFMSKAFVLVLLAALAAGCSGTWSSGGKDAQDLQIRLDQTAFTLKQWKMDGSHRSSVGGTVTIGEKPVESAVLHAGEMKRDIETDAKGKFEILLDQSLLGTAAVKVVSLDQAKVDGKPLSKEEQQQGLTASANMQIYHPITIESVTASGDNTVVKGRLLADKTASVAYFQLDKYRIAGTVKDAEGKPVKGATVWIDRDDGEGFAKSVGTDENGHYEMFYLPEEDEETNLSVRYNSVKYTLPEGKVYHLPEDTSLNIDITLPREGTVIVDKPPTLVSQTAQGALYTGMVVGLDIPTGNTDYTVTIPDAEGRFTLTLPKKTWDQHPAFLETNMTKFIEKDAPNPGDAVPSSFIEVEANAPRGIQAKDTTTK